MTLYQTLAQTFIDDILAQRRPEGSRLPALRKLAQQQGISLSTATSAYDYLQEGGWIYARPQAGYFVANRATSASFPRLHNDTLTPRDPKRYAPKQGYNASMAGFAPLGTSMLAPSLLPEKALQRTIKRITHRSAQSMFHYPDNQGLPSLRRALSQHFRDSHLAFSEQDLLITNSCLESVRMCLESITKEGDTVAVCSPCFSGLLDLLTTLSRKIIEIPVSQEGIDLVALETCFADQKVAAALLSTTHINPLGITLSIAQKQAIAALAEHYQTPIIEDDIYFELSHHKDKQLPAKYWDKAGYILWCSSISKTLAPGLRLGWCLPGRYLKSVHQRHSQTSLGVNSLTQACISEFIESGDYRTHINQMRPRLQQQVAQYRHCLHELLPSGAQISAPDGGLVLWIRVPGLDSQALAQQAAEQGLDIRSGACFSTHTTYDDCLRINCGWPLDEDVNGDNARHQLEKICHLIAKHPSVCNPQR